MRKLGFTLIELLIVVAIIAILAAIAVPNFLEAQTRAKVSRVKADMRSIDTALNAYFVDWNKMPLLTVVSGQNNRGGIATVTTLTSPVSYMTTSRIEDPFIPPVATDTFFDIPQIVGEAGSTSKSINYVNIDAKRKADGQAIASSTKFVLVSYGPDVKRGPLPDPDGAVGLGMYAGYAVPPEGQSYYDRALYDPTNGTVSGGDILRYQGRGTK